MRMDITRNFYLNNIMQTIKKILNAIIGYSGSSENPEVMSLRFSSIIMGVISKIVALCAVAGFVLPYTTADVQLFVSALTLVACSLTWAFGLIRAVVNEWKGV